MLDKPTTSLYQRLKGELIASIERGDYAPGDQLPSQRELAGNFHASHMTVRRALDELMHEGVIVTIPGKGIFVPEPKQIAESCPVQSFTQEMEQRGMRVTSKVLQAKVIPASTMLARAMDGEMGMPLYYLRRIRLADGIPMAVQACYLKSWLCPGLLEHDLENQSLYWVLALEYHICVTSTKGSAEAILADEEHAHLLGVEMPAALLVSEKVHFLEDGQAFEYARSAYRGDRYRLQI